MCNFDCLPNQTIANTLTTPHAHDTAKVKRQLAAMAADSPWVDALPDGVAQKITKLVEDDIRRSLHMELMNFHQQWVQNAMLKRTSGMHWETYALMWAA